MVKKMIVVFSAMALIITTVGVACAFMPGMPGTMGVSVGDMIQIPMKVKTSYSRVTSGTVGGDSTLLLDGCSQYTGGFRPWGVWRGTRCVMKVQVIPPKCVAPAYGGPVAWGAPPSLTPGGRLVSNVEKYTVTSPGCNPCVVGPMKYEMVKKQAVK
jgi:hypothetical protein